MAGLPVGKRVLGRSRRNHKSKNTFAFDRRETLTSAPHEITVSVKKSSVESQGDCRAKAGVLVGRLGADRGAFAVKSRFARLSASILRAGYDVKAQRLVGDEGLAGQICQRTDPHLDRAQATQNPTHRQSGSDTANAAISGALVGRQRQRIARLRVYTIKAQRCAVDQPRALRGYREDVGVLAWLLRARVFQPFDPAQQTGAYVLGGRGHSTDFTPARASVDCQHNRVFGGHATQGRDRRLASSDDAGGNLNWPGIGLLLRVGGINRSNALCIRLVKIVRCQPSLPKWRNLLYNKVVLIFLLMAGMRMTALAAGLGAAMAGGPEEANAQATEIMLPHPEREIVVDVSRVAFETQAEILEKLGACLEEGRAFADVDENGKIEGDEQFDWDDERAFCAETAASNFEQAALQGQIEVANTEQAALRESIDATNRRISALTDAAMSEIQQDGLQASIWRNRSSMLK